MDTQERRSLLPSSTRPAPKDRFLSVYVVFYILGIGSLLPWNFFITAKRPDPPRADPRWGKIGPRLVPPLTNFFFRCDALNEKLSGSEEPKRYFMYKLRNTTQPWDGEQADLTGYQTDLQVMFEGSLAVAATVPNVIFNFSTAALAARLPLKLRMISASVTVIAVFMVTVCLVQIDTDDWQVPFYVVTLISVVILNAASSVFSASMFGLAGMFPVQYMQAVMSGQAVGGVFAAVANIISIAAGSSVTMSAFMYFILATLTSIAALVGFIFLYFCEFSKHHMFCRIRDKTIVVDEDNDEESNNSTYVAVEKYEDRNLRNSVQEGTLSSYKVVLKSIWMEELGVGFTFFVSLTCFPALASAIKPVNKDTSIQLDQYFTAVICFLLFNIGDWTSRVLAGIIKWPNSNQRVAILTLCFCRTVFIPLLIMCNAQPRHLTVTFDNDFYPLVFVSMLGLTNGYLSTLCMMYGPKRVSTEHAEFAGAALSVATTMGLAGGSILGLFLVNWIK